MKHNLETLYSSSSQVNLNSLTVLLSTVTGHGIQTEDFSGDERDNLNECLLPCDYRSSGCIVDDDINRILVRPIPRGCTLHALMDCCHSGTIMDLHYTTFARTSGDWFWETGVATKTYKVRTPSKEGVIFPSIGDIWWNSGPVQWMFG